MKYEEIIGLNDYFFPVYDLKKETGTYWKQFIPTDKFYKILSETINSLESNEPAERKSIWLQGAYGTGKSHATAVIKHLLFDDINGIKDYLEILDEQMRFKIENFRRTKRVFPVVLKGAAFITDNRDLALVIELEVKEALKREGIQLATKTDFEKIVEKLKGDELNWENIFRGTELEAYGTKEDILYKLQMGDIELLAKIEKILSQKDIHIATSNIVDWLIEVRNELKNKGIAHYLMIYWDEFTAILFHHNRHVILSEIQNIAEAAKTQGVYLFVVSHRTIEQARLADDQIEKLKDRFKVLDYSMEPITTYHLISAAIKKIDKYRYEKIRDEYIQQVIHVIKEITKREGPYVQQYLEDLFPIHPYAAYLATLIARYLGSTERSIFDFLYNSEKGFRKFIRENPRDEGKIFVTVDYLWDYFYEEFERIENEKVQAIIEKFKVHTESLSKLGEEYLSVFKGILLLNLLHRFVEAHESSLVSPSEKNIKNLFVGSINQEHLVKILSTIDEQIIPKTPDGQYLITSAGLPLREVESEKRKMIEEYKQRKRYEGAITKLILNSDQNIRLKTVLSDGAHRPVEVVILDAGLKEYMIKQRIEKAFKKNYTIHTCLFLGQNDEEIRQIKSTLRKLSTEEDYKNIIFVVSDVPLGDKTLDRFMEYKARAKVADIHNYSEERRTNEEYANKIIDEWVKQVNSGYIEWFFRDKNDRSLMNKLGEKISRELSKKIFQYGPENIEKTLKNINIWTPQKAKTAAQAFLFAEDREDLEEKTHKYPDKYLREILKDHNGEYIVDENLKLKEGIPDDHPIKNMHLRINKKFEEVSDRGMFHLGKALRFLTKPPYGLYPCRIHMATLGFLLREYVGKLFESGTGKPIQKDKMLEKIMALIEYWDSGKDRGNLFVRFGTVEEEELISILGYIFKISNAESLNDVRWKIREWVKKNDFPIWLFKCSEDINESTKKAIDTIFELIQSTDSEITYEKVTEYLNIIKEVQYDLMRLVEKDHFRELFEKWLNGIEEVEISKDELGEIIRYLKKNMPEEIASWTEDRTREKVKDWYTRKLKEQLKERQKEKEIQGIHNNAISYTKEEKTPDSTKSERYHTTVPEDKLKDIKKLIWESSETRVKNALISFIDELHSECPRLLELIERSLKKS